MSVDVFGRKLDRAGGKRGPPGIGYTLTADGNYDIANKKLCNVAAPTKPDEAVNLGTLQQTVTTQKNINLTADGHYDIANKKLCRVASATRPDEAVNLRTLQQTVAPLKRINYTAEGHFDIANKKLCRVAPPTKPDEAVNLRTLQQSADAQKSIIDNFVSGLKTDIKNLNDLWIKQETTHTQDFYLLNGNIIKNRENIDVLLEMINDLRNKIGK